MPIRSYTLMPIVRLPALFVILAAAVRAISAAPRHTEVALDHGDKTAEIFPPTVVPSYSNHSNRLQYTITRVEPPSLPSRLADNEDTVEGNERVNDSVKSTNFLQTIRKSGILESLLMILSNPQQTPQLRTQPEHSNNAQRQFDSPQILSANSKISSSIDSVPQSVSTFGDDWKHTLFGPNGLFTEVFNMINEKRKEDKVVAKLQAAKTQADATDQSASVSNDFTKIVEAFLSKTQNGNFDEPLPEIPFLGICDRLSCGDIYKAFDEFRKSEMFSNFQTAISLLHDQKGWDIIGEMLANPDLIENFTGKSGNIGELLVGGEQTAKSTDKRSEVISTKKAGDINGADGDLGVDFSSFGEELPKHSEKNLPGEIMPIIAENIDYYSSVDHVEEKIPSGARKNPSNENFRVNANKNTGRPMPAIQVRPNANSNGNNFERRISSLDISLPQIAESVDEFPAEMEHVDVEVEEKIVGTKSQISTTSPMLLARSTATNGGGTFDKRNLQRIRPFLAERNVSIFGKSATPLTTTVLPPPPPQKRTTRTNFRKNNDYYSMYYDDQ